MDKVGVLVIALHGHRKAARPNLALIATVLRVYLRALCYTFTNWCYGKALEACKGGGPRVLPRLFVLLRG